MRRALLLLLLVSVRGHAQPAAPTVIDAIRANQWAQADSLAALEPDPLVRRMVLYYRLLTPGAARATEIAAFMSDSPDWPNQAVLSRRLQDALLTDHDDRAVLDICLRRPPTAPPTMLRCADAAARAILPDNAESPARRAWLAGPLDATAEAAFLKRWGGQLTPDDHWLRFDRLAWSLPAGPGSPPARQALRLAPSRRPAAEARLALKRDDPTAPALFATLAAPHDPTLVLELARWYRRAGLDKDAANVWAGPGPAAEQAAAPDRRGAFWDERNLLARRLLRANEAALAYAVAAPPAASPEGALDQAFLAGWIALRRLNDPALARQHFATLATLSRAALTQSRAHYWLARTLDGPGARAEYDQAALWPTTYYGQLAILARGDDPARLTALVAAAHDPTWSDERATAFLAHDPARAAVLLAAWGEPRRAKAFLARLDETASDPAERALAARLALGLGAPEQAVAIARRAGRDGVMLPSTGWPSPVAPPPGPLEPALVLGLIRQESSFDVQALSPVGARGLMQLMPATAAATARRASLPMNLEALTTDATYNMRLGTAFLQELVGRFHQALPAAIAGYNAGPGRVQDWLVAQDVTAPNTAAADMIDWIELIPFNETRNYVQRVIENVIVYRAQRGDVLPHPVEAPAPLQAAVPG